MADMFSREKRSDIMSKIKSKGTTLEEKGFLLLTAAGMRYRKHPKGIIGKPDAANKSRKIAVFFDSDFWHGFEFEKWRERLPKVYWREKIERNIVRDRVVTEGLKSSGWVVLRLWESEVIKTPDKCVEKVKYVLRASVSSDNNATSSV